MAVDEILQDLLSKSIEESKSPGTMTTDSVSENGPFATSAEGLVLMLEGESQLVYKDLGDGIHFVGLLLAVFAAELVSGYWARNRVRVTGGSERGPKRLVSCLYSKNKVGFVLAHPTEVRLQFERAHG